LTVLKHADDKQPQLDALAALLERSDVDARTRSRIELELTTMRAGIQGERDAAYEIDFHYAAGENHVLIHDLRLEFKERVAQIDHLILNRAFDVWACESKSFSQGVKINDHGEWSRYRPRFAQGMPSPVKQNARHVEVLRDVIEHGPIRLPRRLVTMKPTLMPIVLISNKARIDRPKSRRVAESIDGLDTVIKVERLVETINRSIDARNPVKLVTKFVGTDTIADLGRQLVNLHVPEHFDWRARFGLPSAPPRTRIAEPALAAVHRTCASCGNPVTDKVAQYALDHPERFGGDVLCWDCQRSAKRARA
jgi:hypothetical protein